MPSITIRDIPPETHRELAARAALKGQSLQEYLRSHLIELTRRPDAETLMAQVRGRKRAAGTKVPAEEILAARNMDRT